VVSTTGTGRGLQSAIDALPARPDLACRVTRLWTALLDIGEVGETKGMPSPLSPFALHRHVIEPEARCHADGQIDRLGPLAGDRMLFRRHHQHARLELGPRGRSEGCATAIWSPSKSALNAVADQGRVEAGIALALDQQPARRPGIAKAGKVGAAVGSSTGVLGGSLLEGCPHPPAAHLGTMRLAWP